MTRLIQIKKGNLRRVALVEEPDIRLLDACSSIYELAHLAVATGMKLGDIARQRARQDTLDYDSIYCGRSDWQILPAIDHPDEAARCLISGTGLTHLGSARNRQSMHEIASAKLTDSMKMFQWGVEDGRPAAGCIGIPPEWFYKGTGCALRAHGEPLEVPSYAEDGGEEAEIAGVYLVAPDGRPYRIGMAVGNEFSDHQFEKKNYLNLAGSKLRTCALGPELVVDPEFQSVPVDVTIEREGSVHWTNTFRSGESEMCHSLRNIEHHHFKYETHRRRGDIHVHFFGTDCLSFSNGIHLQHGDVMQIAVEGYGRPLRNPVRVHNSKPALINVIALG
ncbi:MAG TPA: AraD1 family protein [Candidatus Polarisedimenticolia bacterium]|nr:AraD1 family protein [Candidatus Polarisedimenticolia bacterium]